MKMSMKAINQSRPISDIDSMIDPRDTPLIAKLGLDSIRERLQTRLVGRRVVITEKGRILNYNYTSIFQKAIKADNEDAFMYKASMALPHLLRLVERMAFYGSRTKGSVLTHCQSGSFGTFVTHNVTKACGEIQKSHIDSLMEEIIENGGYPDLLVMNPRIALDLRNQLDSSDYVRISKEGKAVEVGITEKVQTKHGDLELMMDRWCPTDEAYILQSDNVGFYIVRPFEAYELARSGENIKGEVLGEFSLLVAEDKVHGKITEITT